MSSVVISGDTSGSITIAAPAVAGTFTQTLPQITGTLGTLNSGTVNAGGANPFNNTLANIDFTGIPANVRRITVMFSGVSLSGTSQFLIQLGTSGGIVTTGYSGGGFRTGTSSLAGANSNAGFYFANITAATVFSGMITITNVTGNTWVAMGLLGGDATEIIDATAGGKVLSAVLDRIRITTVGGTDTFDAGSINILYE
jgi:hypothetical protein